MRREIVIREGKGNKDRHTMRPLSAVEKQLDQSRQQWQRERNARLPGVQLPDALERKKPTEGES